MSAGNQLPSTSQWYRLTNQYTGPTLSLDVVNDAGTASSGTLQMAATGSYSGQYWRFINYPDNSSSTYALYTMFLGPNMRLDVYGNDPTTPHLAAAGDYSGQIWTITPWGDGTSGLTNSFSGSALLLDVYSDTHVPFLDGADHTGQHWTFTSLGNVDDNGPSGSVAPIPTPTTQGSSSLLPFGGAATAQATSRPISVKKAASVGPAVGATIGVVVLLVLMSWFLWRRRFRTVAPPATTFSVGPQNTDTSNVVPGFRAGANGFPSTVTNPHLGFSQPNNAHHWGSQLPQPSNSGLPVDVALFYQQSPTALQPYPSPPGTMTVSSPSAIAPTISEAGSLSHAPVETSIAPHTSPPSYRG